MPFFSVIIPLYNHSAFIAECLRSVLAQHWTDFEAIVVDDGSTDGSGAIADRFAVDDTRIRVIHTPNRGVARARNTAIEQASADWIALLDSDDVWYPTALRDHQRAIEQSGGIARLTYGWYDHINGSQVPVKLPGWGHTAPTTAHDLFCRTFLNPSCVCVRRDLLSEVGPFDPRLPPLEDFDLFLRCGLRCSYHPVPSATTLRRRHGSNISRAAGFKQMLEARVLQRWLDQLGGRALVTEAEARDRLARVYFSAGRGYFRRRCFALAADALRLSQRQRPMLRTWALGSVCWLLQSVSKRDNRAVPELM